MHVFLKNRKRVLSILNDWWATCEDEVSRCLHRSSLACVGCAGTWARFQGVYGTSQEGYRGTLGGHGRHFEIVLNIDRPVNEAAVQRALDLVVPVLDVDWSPSSREQVLDAAGRLKRRKAPGRDGVPAELPSGRK